MKILLIDVNCQVGSTGKIVYDLYTAVNKSGNEAAICYGRGKKIIEKNIFKFGLDIETLIHAFLTRITGFTGCFSPISTRRLLRFIKKFNPDIVHIHELHAYFVNIKPVLSYLKKNNIKTVCTLHCEFMYTGKCGYSIECDKWQSECGNCPHKKSYPTSLFFDKTGYMFRQKRALLEDFNGLRVVTPSKWLADRAAQSFLKAHKISVIHNGIDTETFAPKDVTELRKKHNIAADEKVVLALAPDLMGDIKGGKYVMQLAEEMQEHNIRFIFVGVDEENLSGPSNTVILGRIYDKDLLAQYYSLADVFVICSERDNFPTTCLEAQCCGTPVCGFDIGGIKETMVSIDGNKALPYRDIEALKCAVLEILGMDISRKDFAEQAKKELSRSRMASEYINLYEKMRAD